MKGGDLVASFEYVKTVKPGDTFRDWLVEVLGDRIQNKDCEYRTRTVKFVSLN
jgi:hypothetical protein